MEFIPTANMTHDTAPKEQVLVQYLVSFFGKLIPAYGIGYYDNPNDYEEGGEGWLLWSNDRPITVIAYAILPEEMKFSVEQEGFVRPPFGNFN